MKFRKNYCTTLGSAPALALVLAKCLSFYIKVFYVMGKALTGELSCPVTGLVVLFTVEVVHKMCH